MSWFIRKASAFTTVTLTVKQYTDDKGATHIDIGQRATGGIGNWTEDRTLDWQTRESDNHLWGPISGRSRWLPKIEDFKSESSADNKADLDFLVSNWDPAMTAEGEPGWVLVWVASSIKGWSGEQVCLAAPSPPSRSGR